MNDANPSTYGAVRGFSSFIFLVVVFFGAKVIPQYPIQVLMFAGLTTILGMSAFIYGLVELKRRNPIYDYKPMALWGKNTNGKQIREIFMTFVALGLWMGLTSLAIVLLSVKNLLSPN